MQDIIKVNKCPDTCCVDSVPIKKIKGVIALFDLLCDDGNYGEYNGDLIQLNLYLSKLQ